MPLTTSGVPSSLYSGRVPRLSVLNRQATSRSLKFAAVICVERRVTDAARVAGVARPVAVLCRGDERAADRRGRPRPPVRTARGRSRRCRRRSRSNTNAACDSRHCTSPCEASAPTPPLPRSAKRVVYRRAGRLSRVNDAMRQTMAAAARPRAISQRSAAQWPDRRSSASGIRAEPVPTFGRPVPAVCATSADRMIVPTRSATTKRNRQLKRRHQRREDEPAARARPRR